MMSNKSEIEGFSDWHSSNDVIEPQHNPSTRHLYHKNANNTPTPLHIIKEQSSKSSGIKSNEIHSALLVPRSPVLE